MLRSRWRQGGRWQVGAAPLRPPAPAPSRGDVLLAVLVVGIDTVLFTRLTEAPTDRAWVLLDPVPLWLVVAAGAAAVPVLSFRRRAPVAVCVTLAAWAVLLTVTVGSRPLLTLLVALYTAAAAVPLAPAVVCLGAVLAAHGVAATSEALSVGGARPVLVVVAVMTVFTLLDTTAFGVGRWVAASRARAVELVRSGEALAAATVTAERLRIARELHDVVAHAVTVMVLQTTGAHRVLMAEAPRTSPEVLDALSSVEAVGKQAMSELRRLLEVLRTVADEVDAAEPGPGPDGTGTSPGLSRVPALVQEIRATGVSVAVSTTGTAGPLDPSVDLTAYRIIQESLTNVTRHAGPGTTATVRCAWDDGALVLDITDDGAGTPVHATRGLSSGFGFVGLRERVKLVGGSLDVGPGSASGYRVHAVLPAEPR
ncbi:sensor histidine kinase [Cellulomonas algicola]|uniref:sensor histidine kinase n=1 Tax=Cellulomonas algicola TaxID=2071633 RepID=UPI001C3F5DB1|nr:histidine kinase [Cellulomonas algicola]